MKGKQIFWGLFAILGAVFILLAKLCLFPAFNFVSLLLTVFLVAILLSGLIELGFFRIFFSLAFLGIIYDKYLGIENLTPWTILGIALLLSIGFYLIFSKTKIYRKVHNGFNNNDYKQFVNSYSEGDKATRFGSNTRYINESDFSFTDIDCSFGGVKVFFDGSTVSQKGASIHLNISFSGAELYIPRNWRIINNAMCSFGGVDEKNIPQITPNSPTVTLTGKVSFGGVNIHYI